MNTHPQINRIEYESLWRIERLNRYSHWTENQDKAFGIALVRTNYVPFGTYTMMHDHYWKQKHDKLGAKLAQMYQYPTKRDETTDRALYRAGERFERAVIAGDNNAIVKAVCDAHKLIPYAYTLQNTPFFEGQINIRKFHNRSK